MRRRLQLARRITNKFRRKQTEVRNTRLYGLASVAASLFAIALVFAASSLTQNGNSKLFQNQIVPPCVTESYQPKPYWYGGYIVWFDRVGWYSVGLGTQDLNDDGIRGDVAAGWVVSEFGCFKDLPGMDVAEIEFGNNETGAVWVGTEDATMPNPNSSGDPRAFGWRYVGWVGDGNNDNVCHTNDFNIGDEDGTRYRYIYFWSEGHERGCEGSDCNPGSSADVCFLAVQQPVNDPGTPPNDAKCQNITAPASVTVGQSFSGSATMLNTGTATWVPTGTNRYALSSESPSDNMRWGLNRVALSGSVPNGGTAAFTINATAPASPGTYAFDWGMVQEGVAHFGAVCKKSITVTPEVITSIVVTPPAATVPVGNTQQYTAVAMCGPVECLTQPTFSWTSADPATATVNATGLATGVKVGGPIYITASAGGLSGAATITVVDAAISSIVVTPPTATVTVGSTQQYTATAMCGSAECVVQPTFSWTSADPATATVNATGLATGVKVGGPITITASAGGKSGTATIKVVCLDTDGDGVCDILDNCPLISNPDQSDIDGDGFGDVCDTCTDIDKDKVCDDIDNCPTVYNPGQEDADGNMVGDACDDIFTDIFDAGDGMPACPWELMSFEGSKPYIKDGDTLVIETSSIPFYESYSQTGPDLNFPDKIVAESYMRVVSGTEDRPSRRGAAIGISISPGYGNALWIGEDNKIFLLSDSETVGDFATVDTTAGFHWYRIEVIKSTGAITVYYDGVPTLEGVMLFDVADWGREDQIWFGDGTMYAAGVSEWKIFKHNSRADQDKDGVADTCDNCPSTSNSDQKDTDADGVGDVCDNCVANSNPTQVDSDGDGIGDACECKDTDGDGICDATDNCPNVSNPTQADADGDTVGDSCDNCPDDANPDQADADSDGIGDVCEIRQRGSYVQVRVTPDPHTGGVGSTQQFTAKVYCDVIDPDVLTTLCPDQSVTWDPQWAQIPGFNMYNVDAGADGSVWAISRAADANGNAPIYRMKADKSGWDLLTGVAKRIAVASVNQVYVVQNNGDVYVGDGVSWTKLPGNAMDIDVGADGTVWAIANDPDVNGNGTVQKLKADKSGWDTSSGGRAKRVAVNAQGGPIVAQADGSLWYNPDSWQRVGAPGAFTAYDLSIGADNSVWALKLSDYMIDGYEDNNAPLYKMNGDQTFSQVTGGIADSLGVLPDGSPVIISSDPSGTGSVFYRPATSLLTIDSSGMATLNTVGQAILNARAVTDPKRQYGVVVNITSCTTATGLTIAPKTVITYVGGYNQLNALVSADCTPLPPVTWTSADPTIATVDAEGTVTGVKPGVVTATATAGGKTDTATITVICYDADGDGICDTVDNCPNVTNPTQDDADNDKIGDSCDNCPNTANPDQKDTDGDGVGDVCEACANVIAVIVTPATKTINVSENVTLAAAVNPSACTEVTWTSSDPTIGTVDATGKVTGIKPGTVTITATAGGKTGTAQITVICLDTDGDGICDTVDNCKNNPNPNQVDSDGDGIGDVCDPCTDVDKDGICDTTDVCLGTNPPASCNVCKNGATTSCLDNCKINPNPDQKDADGDGIGDVCDTCNDVDKDGICENTTELCKAANPPAWCTNVCKSGATTSCYDNCPANANANQADTNGNGIGDVCETNSCGTPAPFTSTFSLTIPLEARDNDTVSNRGDHSESMVVRLYSGTTKLYEKQGTSSATGVLGSLSDPSLKTCTPYTLLVKSDQSIAGVIRNFQLTPTGSNAFTLPTLLMGDVAGVPDLNKPLLNWGTTLGDCTVNTADISEIYLYWGKKTNRRSDIDKNTETGAEDFSITRKNLNRTCPVPQ